MDKSRIPAIWCSFFCGGFPSLVKGSRIWIEGIEWLLRMLRLRFDGKLRPCNDDLESEVVVWGGVSYTQRIGRFSKGDL